jgi:UDPglucose 6-dehydrogenase
MKVTVIGVGYVGLVSGACLADVGHDVLCFDTDRAKVDFLRGGGIPIFEPGLEAIVKRNIGSGRLRFSSDAKEAGAFGKIQMIAVGTPPGEDGSADLRYVQAAARAVGQHMTEFKVVVDKSTVPVGTADLVEKTIRDALQARGSALDFVVVSNPEFLKEGAAVNDFNKPDRIVVGVEDKIAESLMKELYAPFLRNHDKLLVMTRRSAELTKYAANAMLATRISFMNEMANLAEKLGADIEDVRKGMGSDPRIGYSFLYSGSGYGGSCFPKDIRALRETGIEMGQTLHVLNAVEEVNERQKTLLVDKAAKRLGSLRGLQFAVWGLAFKPNTDDVREAPALEVIRALLGQGATVRAYDPIAQASAHKLFGQPAGLTYCTSSWDALEGSTALFLMTEWREFWSPDFSRIAQTLKQPLIFDGRNMFNPEVVKSYGLEYYGIGRGLPLH